MRLEKLSLILHFYQPSIQTQNQFKQIFDSSYFPLLRVLRSKKNCRFTLNIPLSFLELADSYGYKSWIEELAKLYDQGVIELLGTGAYHPLLNSVPNTICTDEIILQEYGLGYYFGKHTGFDGEKEILIRDIKGFFPPELAISGEVCSLLNDLGYKWVLADECSVENKKFPLVQHTSGVYVLLRNTSLSNMLAFHRGFDTTPLYNELKEYGHEHLVLALDAETFGHHNKQGVVLLDILVDQLLQKSVRFETASALVEELSDIKDSIEIKEVLLSSWGATVENVRSNNPLPMWKIPTNPLHVSIWQLFSYLFTSYDKLEQPVALPVLGNVPFWKHQVTDTLDISTRHYIESKFMLFKLLASDFLWWASGAVLFNVTVLLDKELIRKYLVLGNSYALYAPDRKVGELCDAIESLL
jgi:hypothetical protein